MPFDPNELPDLARTPAPEEKNFLADLIRRRKLVGQLGDVDYSIGLNKAEFETPIGNAMAKAIFDYEGNRKFELNSPLLGGNVNFSVNDPNNERAKFFLNYRRQF